MGNKTVYELTTESGRAINTTSNHPYLVKLYTKEECDKYAGTVWNKNISRTEFDEKGFCTRWVEVSELKESMEIAVPRLEDDYLSLDFSSNLSNSAVVNILTLDCFLNASSSDQIGKLNANAKAKYGSSFVPSPCGEILLASGKNSLYSFSLNTSSELLSSERMSLNSASSILANLIMSSLLFDNSSRTKSGEINLHSCSRILLNTSLLAESALKNENSIEASTTNSSGTSDGIYNPCLLATLFFNSSPSLRANSSVILLFFNISSNLLKDSSLLNFSANASLATSDQLIHENFFKSDLTSSETVNVTVAIYNSPRFFNASNFFNSSSLFSIPRLITSFQSTSGNFLLAPSNSLGNDTVIVAIFLPPLNSIYTMKSVDIFKSFDAGITFEKIVSIKSLDKQQVYDLEIEGTHNFLANDIVAHNTNGDGNNPVRDDFNASVNTSGLVGLWYFNNESAFGENATGGSADIVRDFSPDVNSERSGSIRNNGTTKGGATINKTDYKLGGGAGQFNGTNDGVSVADANSLDYGTVATHMAWVKLKEVNRLQFILRKWVSATEDKSLYVDSSNKANCLMYNFGGVLTSVTALSQNPWYHTACTYDGSTAKIYINGILDNSASRSGDVSDSTGTLEFGFTPEGNAYSLNGTIDEVSIWNRSLSSAEILNLYKRGALRLNLSVRSCDDSACSGESYTDVDDNSSGTKLNETISPINRFFQYRFVFNSNDTNYTPVLFNLTLNYTTVATDSFGNYNYTFSAPTEGTYIVKVNTTWTDTIPGEQLATLTVTAATDTCSCPSSGDWGINVADNCVITSNCNMQGNNVYVYGTGTLTINALIYNFNRFATHGSNVVCIRQGGCFG